MTNNCLLYMSFYNLDDVNQLERHLFEKNIYVL